MHETLALKLIAKQVSSSHLTLEKAYERLSNRGFMRIAPEQIKYEKDGKQECKRLYRKMDWSW